MQVKLLLPTTSASLTRSPVFASPRANCAVANGKSLALAVWFSLAAPLASAASLGDAEVRSYLGESLHVRVPVQAAGDESLDSECFSIGVDSAPFSVFRDARTALISPSNTPGTKVLAIRTFASVNEPVITLSLRYACPGQGAVSREYTLLLDLPPANQAAVQAAARAASSSAVTNSVATATPAPPTSAPHGPQWTVRDGDSLASIASSIFPGNARLQSRFVQAVRAENPSLANVANAAPLTPASMFTLPDLRRIASRARTEARVDPERIPEAGVDPPAPTRKPKQISGVSGESARNSAPSGDVAVPGKTKAAEPRSELQNRSTTRKKSKAEREFSLRLSGGDIDVRKSQNVTEEQRALLREKQAMLDADDQLAQFLALKNSVRVLEKRLNELQSELRAAGVASKLSTATAPVTPVAPTGAESAAPAPAANTQTAAPSVPPPTAEASAAADQAPTKSAAKAPPAPSAAVAGEKRGLLSWIWRIAAGVGVLAALAWIGFRIRQNRLRQRAETLHFTAIEDIPAEPPAEQATAGASRAGAREGLTPEEEAFFAEAKRMALEREREQHEADERALNELRDARERVGDLLPSSSASTPVGDAKLSEPPDPAFANTVRLDQPLEFETPARFDLDDTPTTEIDFPLDELNNTDPRLLRVQYMHERYPELRNKTVSIDSAASVVNAARLYFEENDIGKACELLTFGIEERPQELSFWLAQFEIYRRAQMADDFVALAQKFSFLFSQSVEFKKVLAIGKTMASLDPLFADAPPLERVFNPSVDTWLGAPDAAARSALLENAQAFRTAMLSIYGLNESDVARSLATGAAA